MKKIIAFLIVSYFAFVFVSSAVAFSTTVNFAWDQSPEPDLEGYKIYYGSKSRL